MQHHPLEISQINASMLSVILPLWWLLEVSVQNLEGLISSVTVLPVLATWNIRSKKAQKMQIQLLK